MLRNKTYRKIHIVISKNVLIKSFNVPALINVNSENQKSINFNRKFPFHQTASKYFTPSNTLDMSRYKNLTQDNWHQSSKMAEGCTKELWWLCGWDD